MSITNECLKENATTKRRKAGWVGGVIEFYKCEHRVLCFMTSQRKSKQRSKIERWHMSLDDKGRASTVLRARADV